MPRAEPWTGWSALVLASIALLVPHAGRARDEPTLGGLLARFRAMPGLEARFREEKHIALLAAPIVNEGKLWFAPPDHLLRRIDEPSPSALLLEGPTLRMREGGETRVLDVDASPPVRAFVDSFRALLAGDRAALERQFAMRFEPRSGDGWRLTMRPKDRALRKAIERITVEGTGVVLGRLVVDERTGDRSVTTFRDVDAHRRYGGEEMRRLFRLR